MIAHTNLAFDQIVPSKQIKCLKGYAFSELEAEHISTRRVRLGRKYY